MRRFVVQVIQPTPCMTPSGDGSGSQESFSDVPRHTEQLLPSASARFRKQQQHKSPSSSSAAAPIASIRTSCSSCSDDGASTATTVNSSVFADDCCSNAETTATTPKTSRVDERYASPAEPSQTAGDRGRGNGNRAQQHRDRVDGVVTTVGAGTAVGSFHDFNRGRPAPPRQTSIPGEGMRGRNVIVVQAEVNPIADSIVNANSLSGSLRALYDASKETLF